MNSTLSLLLKRRSTQVTLAIVFVLFITGLIATPYIIGYNLKQWIQENGHESVELQDVDFNPFTGSLAIHELKATTDDTTPLEISKLELQFDWLRFLGKRIILKGITIEGVSLQVERTASNKIQIGGIATDSQSSTQHAGDETPWQLAIDSLQLRDIDVHYRAPDIQSAIKINHFNLDNLDTLSIDQAVSIKLDSIIDDAPFILSGQLKPFSKPVDFTGHISTSQLRLQRYASLMPADFKILNANININTDINAQITPGESVTMVLNGKVLVDKARVELANDQLFSGSMEWEGMTDVQFLPVKQKVDINVEGKASLETIQYFSSNNLKLAMSSAAWLGKIKVTRDEGSLGAGLTGELNSNNLDLNESSQSLNINYAALNWKGKSSFQTSDTSSSATYKLSGNTGIRDFSYSYNRKNGMRALFSQLNLEGDATYKSKADSDTQTFEFIGDTNIDNFSLTSTQPEDASAEFKRLDFTGFKISHPDSHALENMIIESVRLGEDKNNKAVIQLDKLIASSIQHSASSGLSINEVELVDGEHFIARAKDESWNINRFIDRLKLVFSGEDKPGKSSQGDGIPIAINSLQLSGKQTLNLNDSSVKPAFNQAISIKQASITKIDSKNNRASPFTIAGKLGKQSDFSFSGKVAPFSGKISLDGKGKIEGYPLPPLSGYARSMLGYTFDSGELNLDSDLHIKDGVVDGKNEFKLHQVAVTAISKEELASLESKPDVPLETGLSMLRDKNNNIKINIPVTGALETINIDPSDAINQAVNKAMKQAAKTYLTVALFPYGTLLTIAEAAGENALKIKLDPVIYPPGDTKLSEKHMEYLGKISDILNERPEIYIKLCGIASQSDHDLLLQIARTGPDGKALPADKQPASIDDEQLLELAQQRADIIESALTEKFQQKANRLISCQPSIDKNTEGSPRAELSL